MKNKTNYIRKNKSEVFPRGYIFSQKEKNEGECNDYWKCKKQLRKKVVVNVIFWRRLRCGVFLFLTLKKNRLTKEPLPFRYKIKRKKNLKEVCNLHSGWKFFWPLSRSDYLRTTMKKLKIHSQRYAYKSVKPQANPV